MYDVIIVGRGPAGISAALYTTRANYKTLILGRDLGSLEKAGVVENYFGFSGPVEAKKLLDDSIQNALRLGAEILEDEVVSIDAGDGYVVTTSNGQFDTKSVILATGRQRKKVNIMDIEKYEGRGVSYCSVCDGFFFRGKAVGVVGSGDYAIHEAENLLNFTQSVTIFTNGEELKAQKEPPCKVEGRKILKVFGEDKIQGVELEGGEIESLDGIFIAVGVAGSADFARKLGVEVRNGAIVTDGQGRTGVPGLFAAGDCVGDFLQIATAVGQGALAARSAIEFLKGR